MHCDCNSIRQSYNSENTVAKFLNFSPEANSGVALNFDADWILNNFSAPFFLDIRTLTQNFILKISSVLVIRHDFLSIKAARLPKIGIGSRLKVFGQRYKRGDFDALRLHCKGRAL